MSENIDLNLLRNLTSLGFTEKEGRVYITLLQGGPQSAIGISKVLGLHRQFVYNALDSLKERGFVVRLNAHANWRAENPRKLIAFAEEQEKTAVQTATQLSALKEEVAGQEFEVTEGTGGFRTRILTTMRRLPRDSVVLMICGEWDRYFSLAGKEAHTQWDELRIAKNIRFRIIGPTSFLKSMDDAARVRSLTEYRVLPGLEKSLLNTVIYHDRIDFDIYGSPHVTFSIKNADVAKSQREFFETLWKLGEAS